MGGGLARGRGRLARKEVSEMKTNLDDLSPWQLVKFLFRFGIVYFGMLLLALLGPALLVGAGIGLYWLVF